MDFVCLIQVRLEGRDRPVHVEYTQGTSVQAVLERACRTLGIYDSWNYALYSLLFKSWLCDSHLLSSYPAEDTLIVRKKTPQYLELTYNEENPKKRSMSTTSLSPNIQPAKRRGIFSQKTCLKTRFQQETIYLSAILFTSDSKILITSGSRMFPTVEVIRDQQRFGNFETDCEEFSLVLRTSLDWATSTDFDKDENISDTDSIHSAHSNTNSIWARAFGQAVVKLKNELSLDTLGTLYEHVVPMSLSKSKFIVTMQHIPQQFKDDIAPDLIKSGTLKWKNFDETNSIYAKEGQSVWINYIEKWCSRQSKLSPGLYLGVLYTESTLQGIRVLVPQDRKQFIPLEKIRDDANITPEEASWVKSLTCLSPDCFMDLVEAAADDHNDHHPSSSHVSSPSTIFGRFQTSFMDSYHKLQLDTNLTWDSHDIYGEQTVDIYLDLQNNQMFTMMGELDDHIEGQTVSASAFNAESPLTDVPQLHSSPSLRNEKLSRLSRRKSSFFTPTSEKRKTAPAILAHAKIPSFSDAPPLPDVHFISLANNEQQPPIVQKEDIIKNEESASSQDQMEQEQNNEDNSDNDEAIAANVISITPAAVTQENIKAINESSGQDSSTTSNSNEDEVVTALEEGSTGEMEVEAPEPRPKEEEDEINSVIKSSDSTGGATSVAGETTSTAVASTVNGSFNTAANSMKPFIRVILIVKPMRQPHQTREPYRSGLCILYPFHLFDALQHATFNACLYASSRRAMQILQASKVYFTQDLVRYLQRLDNFCEVTEQNVEDYFFDSEDFQNAPEEVKKIQQALEIIRDEINGLKAQWNAVSWSMTVIEWDRQRTMQSYSFGARPSVHSSTSGGSNGKFSVGGNGNGNRAASVYNMKADESNDSDSTSMSTIRPSDTAAQIEFLRDMMLHAPDRAWQHIRTIGAPIPIVNADGTSSRPNNLGRSLSSSSSGNTSTRPRPPIGPLLTQFFATSSAINSLSSNSTTPIVNRSSPSSSIDGSSEFPPIQRRQRSSSVSSVSSVTSTRSANMPIRKKSAGHRLMRTLGFGNSSQGSNEQPPPEIPKSAKRSNNKKETKKNITEDHYIILDDGNDNISIDEKTLLQQELPVNQENNVPIKLLNNALESSIVTPPPLTPLTPTFILNANGEPVAEETKSKNNNINDAITSLSSSENNSASNNNLMVASLNNQEQQSIPITLATAQHARISMISNSDSLSSDGSNRMSTVSNDTVITTDTSVSTTSSDDQDVSLSSNPNVENQQESERSDNSNTAEISYSLSPEPTISGDNDDDIDELQKQEQDKEQVVFVDATESETMETKNHESEENVIVISDDESKKQENNVQDNGNNLKTVEIVVSEATNDNNTLNNVIIIEPIEHSQNLSFTDDTSTTINGSKDQQRPSITIFREGDENYEAQDSLEPTKEEKPRLLVTADLLVAADLSEDDDDLFVEDEFGSESVITTTTDIVVLDQEHHVIIAKEEKLMTETSSLEDEDNVKEQQEVLSENIIITEESMESTKTDQETVNESEITSTSLAISESTLSSENNDGIKNNEQSSVQNHIEDDYLLTELIADEYDTLEKPSLQITKDLPPLSKDQNTDDDDENEKQLTTTNSSTTTSSTTSTFEPTIQSSSSDPNILTPQIFEDPKLQTFTEELAGVTLAEELLRVALAEEFNNKPVTITPPSSIIISGEKVTTNNRFSEITSSSSGRSYVNVNEEVKKLASVIAEVKQSATLIAAQVKPVQQQQQHPPLPPPTSKPLPIQQQRDRVKPTPNLIAGQNMKLRPLTLLEELEKDSYLSSSSRNSSNSSNSNNLPSPPISTEISPASTPEPSQNNSSSLDLPPLPDSPVTAAMTTESSAGSSTPTSSKKKRHSPGTSQSFQAPLLPPQTSKWHTRSISSESQQKGGGTLRKRRPSKIVLPSQLTPPTLSVPLSKSAPTTPSYRVSARNHIPPPLPLPPLSARLSPPPLPLPSTSPNGGGESKIPLPSSSNSNSRKNSQTLKSPLNSPPATTIPGPFSSTHTRPATPAKINSGSTSMTRNPPPLPLPPASSRITPSPYVLSQQTPRVNPPPLPLPPASASPFFAKLKNYKAKQEVQEQREQRKKFLQFLPQEAQMQQERERLEQQSSQQQEQKEEKSQETSSSTEIAQEQSKSESKVTEESAAATKVDETTRPTTPRTPRTSSLKNFEQMIFPSLSSFKSYVATSDASGSSSQNPEICENVQEQKRSLSRYTRARAKSLADGFSKRQVPSLSNNNSPLPDHPRSLLMKMTDGTNSGNREMRRRGSAAWITRPSTNGVADANSGIPVFLALAKNNGPSSFIKLLKSVRFEILRYCVANR
ncbi:6180_t:CDS:10 [Ambispora gerdemannii]|uniref:6180_t:CDS:1 n=1 Tax=Ambispora gerdemannii TaxID=144530 RepID=A0A9N9F7P7_9GLOM|nr:6180_t:CDS:10 [Ambispora gerdemannii]